MGIESVTDRIRDCSNAIRRAGGTPVELTLRTETGLYSSADLPIISSGGDPVTWYFTFPHGDNGRTITVVGRI